MPVEIFCCYARKDKQLLRELKAHIMPLRLQKHVTIWDDTDINAGQKWEREIEKHLNTADIILLLISPDFMASEYCYSKEMQRAMERHVRGEARVIPIILRPVNWQRAPFSMLQVLPTNAKPVTDWSWDTEDNALYNVGAGIHRAIEDILAGQQLIEFSIQQGDITSFDADVLALKYAQEFFGTDEIIAHLLDKVGIALETLRPRIGDYRYVETRNCIQAHHALFVGVPDILDFNYQHIQEW